MKYLRKNEFRYGKPYSKIGSHPAHINGEDNKYIYGNVITHSNRFFGKKTFELYDNPNKNNNQKIDSRKRHVSIRFRDKKNRYSRKLKNWHMSNANLKIEKRINKK